MKVSHGVFKYFLAVTRFEKRYFMPTLLGFTKETKAENGIAQLNSRSESNSCVTSLKRNTFEPQR